MAPAVQPVVVVHAGAGAWHGDMEAQLAACRHGLAGAIAAARAALDRGDGAVEAVCAAVTALEDCALFNAGVGSALCADGTVQMSASLMRGADRAAGAVAGLRSVRNPIRAAAAVLDSPQVLLMGPDADRRAAAGGADCLPNQAFVTERQRHRLRDHVHGEDHGTVGAVVRDATGALAAGTSTGGVTAQPPGRVGDSPLIGAGTWADARVAVSCTGDGEYFIRAAAAASVAGGVAAGGALSDCAATVLADVRSLGGYGGLIALAADGEVATPYTSQTMLHGIWRPGAEADIRIPPPG